MTSAGSGWDLSSRVTAKRWKVWNQQEERRGGESQKTYEEREACFEDRSGLVVFDYGAGASGGDDSFGEFAAVVVSKSSPERGFDDDRALVLSELVEGERGRSGERGVVLGVGRVGGHDGGTKERGVRLTHLKIFKCVAAAISRVGLKAVSRNDAEEKKPGICIEIRVQKVA